MGDIVGLVEAAQSAVDQEEARRQQEKLAKGKFDLNDFRQQLTQMKKMGSVKDLMGMIPGMKKAQGALAEAGGYCIAWISVDRAETMEALWPPLIRLTTK